MPQVKGIKYWKKKAWTEFSKYIRTRDAAGKDYANCVTCFKPYPAFGKGCLQAGHFIPGRNNQVLFDERQVFSQCYNCNVNLKGNWPSYLRVMKSKYGDEVVQEMLDTHKNFVKYSATDYEDIYNRYKDKLDELTREYDKVSA